MPKPKKTKMVDDPAMPDINESKIETGHMLDQMTPDVSANLHRIIKTANETLPMNKTVNITEALIQIIIAAFAAYEAHVGAPYDPDNLPDEPPIE